MINNNFIKVVQPPYSPDIAICDFFLFGRVKKLLERRHTKEAKDLNEQTDNILHSISSEITAAFSEWGTRLKYIIQNDGDYYNKASPKVLATFLKPQPQSVPSEANKYQHQLQETIRDQDKERLSEMFHPTTTACVPSHDTIPTIAKDQRNDTKRYECVYPDCTYSTNKHYNYSVHLRTHTGEKPFHCSVPGCSYTSITKSNIKKHLQTMHKVAYDENTHIASKIFQDDKQFHLLETSNLGFARELLPSSTQHMVFNQHFESNCESVPLSRYVKSVTSETSSFPCYSIDKDKN